MNIDVVWHTLLLARSWVRQGKTPENGQGYGVDDFGNYQLVSAHNGGQAIKVKVKRETPVPGDKAWLKFPEKRCCVYADEVLV